MAHTQQRFKSQTDPNIYNKCQVMLWIKVYVIDLCESH